MTLTQGPRLEIYSVIQSRAYQSGCSLRDRCSDGCFFMTITGLKNSCECILFCQYTEMNLDLNLIEMDALFSALNDPSIQTVWRVKLKNQKAVFSHWSNNIKTTDKWNESMPLIMTTVQYVFRQCKHHTNSMGCSISSMHHVAQVDTTTHTVDTFVRVLWSFLCVFWDVVTYIDLMGDQYHWGKLVSGP